MKKFFLILLIAQLFTNQAIAYSKENIINFFYKIYEDQVGISFWKKENNISNTKLRQRILVYLKHNNRLVEEQEIEKAWQEFMLNNFKNPLDLKIIAQDNYKDLDQAKIKFIEDLDLKNFFQTEVVARIEKDLALRDKLNNSILVSKMSSIEKKESILQFFKNYNIDSIQELKDKYYLSEEDLDFLLDTNYAIEKKAQSIYNLDLEKRISNLINNSNYSYEQARKSLLGSYKNKIEYLL